MCVSFSLQPSHRHGLVCRLLTRNVRSKIKCSACSAIYTAYRSLLRSSSTRQPSDPRLGVNQLVFVFVYAEVTLCVQQKELVCDASKQAKACDTTKHSLCLSRGYYSPTTSTGRLNALHLQPAQMSMLCTHLLRLNMFAERPHDSIMIHPQVHIRIPCYDFYFL